MKAQGTLKQAASARAKWLEQLGAFRRLLGERREFERQALVWGATIEVRGQRFSGTLMDFSEGGARLSFDGPLAQGEEIKVVLDQIGELGAQTIWRKEGETGIKFLLAPKEVADRVQVLLRSERRADLATPSPAPRSRGVWLGVAAASTLLMGLLIVAGAWQFEAVPGFIMPIQAGAYHQHDCEVIVEKVASATTGVDFNRWLAEAYQRRCLTRKIDGAPTVGRSDTDTSGHITRVTKVPSEAP